MSEGCQEWTCLLRFRRVGSSGPNLPKYMPDLEWFSINILFLFINIFILTGRLKHLCLKYSIQCFIMSEQLYALIYIESGIISGITCYPAIPLKYFWILNWDHFKGEVSSNYRFRFNRGVVLFDFKSCRLIFYLNLYLSFTVRTPNFFRDFANDIFYTWDLTFLCLLKCDCASL